MSQSFSGSLFSNSVLDTSSHTSSMFNFAIILSDDDPYYWEYSYIPQYKLDVEVMLKTTNSFYPSFSSIFECYNWRNLCLCPKSPCSVTFSVQKEFHHVVYVQAFHHFPRRNISSCNCKSQCWRLIKITLQWIHSKQASEHQRLWTHFSNSMNQSTVKFLYKN